MSNSSNTDAQVRKNWGDDDALPAPMNGAVGLGLAEVLIRVVQAQPDVTTVCDLGSGTGYLSSRLGALGYRVTGIDASDRLLAVANEHFASDRVTFQRGIIGEDSLDALAPPGGFDLVVSSDVVEHLFHPKSLVDAAFRILRPGGHLVLGHALSRLSQESRDRRARQVGRASRRALGWRPHQVLQRPHPSATGAIRRLHRSSASITTAACRGCGRT